MCVCVCVCADEVMAFRRTLIYVANALRQQAAAAAAETSDGKSLRHPSSAMLTMSTILLTI